MRLTHTFSGHARRLINDRVEHIFGSFAVIRQGDEVILDNGEGDQWVALDGDLKDLSGARALMQSARKLLLDASKVLDGERPNTYQMVQGLIVGVDDALDKLTDEEGIDELEREFEVR